jgi:hypothetical protein
LKVNLDTANTESNNKEDIIMCKYSSQVDKWIGIELSNVYIFKFYFLLK